MVVETTPNAAAAPDGLGKPIKEVIIIGAGIGGLVVANALRNKGLKVDVYERAEVLNRQRGGGTGLSQNGQTCLHAVGFSHDAVMKISTPVLEHVMVNGNYQVVARSEYPTRLYEKYGIPLTGTLRGDLVDMLAGPLRKAKALHLGHKVEDIKQDTPDRVKVIFSDGKTKEADLVIGADGINSTVAKILLGDKMDASIYSGHSVFFGVIDNFHKPSLKPLPPPGGPPVDKSLPLEDLIGHPNAIVQFLAPGKIFLVPGGAGKDKKLVWKLGYDTDSPPNRKEWVEGATIRQELEAHLKKNYAPDFPVWDLLARTKDERLLHFGVYSRGHKSFWHKGRVVIMGDAAHATLPHLGQGANMAIEDGVVLTQCLEGPGKGFRDVETALQEFYRLRKDRTKRIVNSSWIMGKLWMITNYIGPWGREKLLQYVMDNDIYLKFAEKEIIEHCPLPLRNPSKEKQG